MTTNTPTTGDNPFHWWQYDVLPSIVRRAIQNAPIKLGSEFSYLALRRGRDPRREAQLLTKVARASALRMVLDDYGPEHPSLQGALHE